MTSLAARRVDPSGHCEYLTPVFNGHASGDQSAAGQIRLDDDCAESHPGDNPVANREALFVGFAVERELGNEGALGGNALEKFDVFGGEYQVDPGAQDGDGAAF
jgi:hypothetical protein